MAIELIDAGWGDWRLGDDFRSRLTQTQADALRRFGPDAEAGVADVRFGDEPDDIIVFEGERVFEVGIGGTVVDVTPEGPLGYPRGVDVTASYSA